MLNKNYKKGSFWKSLALIPVSLILLFFIACGNEAGVEGNPPDENRFENIFYIVDEMPQWPGEDDFATSLRQFIAKNLKYPAEAAKHGTEGKVFITFMVTENGDVVIPDPEMLPPEKNENGEISEVVVVAYKKLNSENEMPEEQYISLLKEEGKRVVELIPNLIPGKQAGKPANVIFTLPITFKLD